MRHAASGWIAKLLIMLLMLSFAAWGVSGIFNGNNEKVLAKVGDTEISLQNFRKSLQLQIQAIEKNINQKINARQAWSNGIVDQVLKKLLFTATLDNDADVRGLGVTDAVIARSIMDEPAFKDLLGNFDRNYFERILRSNNLLEQDYTMYKRKLHKQQQIIGAIAAGGVIPKILLEAIHQFNVEQRSIAYMVLKPEMVTANAGVSLGINTMSDFFSIRKEQFRLPEYRKVELLMVIPEQLSSSIKISEEELRKEYEARKDTFQQRERRQIEQIMFKNIEEAQVASSRMKSGSASFDDISKELKLTKDDISLGLLEQDKFLDSFVGEIAFSLKLGAVSAPIEGKFGSSLLRVIRIEPEQIKYFEDISGELHSSLAMSMARDKALELHDKVEDQRAAGSKFSEISHILALPYRVIENINAQGLDETGKNINISIAHSKVLKLLFQVGPGVETDPVSLDDGSIIWFNVLGTMPPRIRTFEEAKDDVEQLWYSEQLRGFVAIKSRDLLVKLQQGGNFEDIAKSIGGTIHITAPFSRASSMQELSAAALKGAFALPLNTFGVSEHTDGVSRVLFQVRSIEIPAFDPSSEITQAITDWAEKNIGDDNLASYVADRQRKFGITVDNSALITLFGSP